MHGWHIPINNSGKSVYLHSLTKAIEISPGHRVVPELLPDIAGAA